MNLQFTVLDGNFSVCKIKDPAGADLRAVPFVSLTVTGEEISLVCPEKDVPKGSPAVEMGWRCLKILGPLDFSLTGVLAEVSAALAQKKISIFAVSTYNTDYILVKEDRVPDAVKTLTEHGCVYIE